MSNEIDAWPAGATFLFNILIANEAAAGAGNIELIYTAGEGNEFEVLYGMIVNLDTVARTLQAYIDTGTSDENVVNLDSQSLGAGAGLGFPKAAALGANEASGNPGRYMVSGPMRLRLISNSVADGQDARFRGALRLKGAIPTRSTVGQGTEVVTVTTQRVV